MYTVLAPIAMMGLSNLNYVFKSYCILERIFLIQKNGETHGVTHIYR